MRIRFITFIALKLAVIILAIPPCNAGAQSIDVELPGSASGDAFTVKNKAGKVLLKVFGDNHVSIGTHTNTTSQLRVVAPIDKQALYIEGNMVDNHLVQVVNKTQGSGFNTTGILAEIYSQDGQALYGMSYSTSGTQRGVFGRVQSADAVGVYGYNSAVTSRGYLGHKLGGVYGEASTGNMCGVYGKTLNSTTWAGYFEGSVNVTGGLDVAGTLIPSGYVYCKDKLGVKKPLLTIQTYDFAVWGTAGKTGGGSWSSLSDIRLKNIVGSYTKGLQEIVQLEPIRFRYKKDNPRGYPSNAEEVGYSAQAIRRIFPEAVTEAEDGYLDMNMHAIHIATISAVKELHELVERQSEQIRNQDKQISEQKKRLAKQDARFAMQEKRLQRLEKSFRTSVQTERVALQVESNAK
jgi:endosialidase-like protein